MGTDTERPGPDPDQRKAIELRRNGVVSAGAGSGKTTVLAARYLDLIVRDGADVRSILVLTFTRKAAAEMYARIYRELLRSPDPRARNQVDRFSESQISTLDSFCSLVLRPEAQDYGYPPDFTIDDTECRRIAETQALSFLLERREDPALREVFARLGFETAWRDLFADAAARLWTPSSAPDVADMAERQRTALRAFVRKKTDVIRAAEALVAVESASSPAPGAKAAETAAVLTALPRNLEEMEASEAAEAVRGVAALSFTGFGRSIPDVRIKEAAKEAREAAKSVLDAADMAAQAPLAEAVLNLLAELGERVGKAKRLGRVMGFHDAATAAVDLLIRRIDVRDYWKRRFRFIMIDEFQDNNDLQKELLYLLAERADRSSPDVPTKNDLEPNKLFFVGDEKQSIYRFRGADVSVFRGLSADLGGGGPALGTNYRSEPRLVDFFNDLFRRVMGDAERDFEARFAPISARSPTNGVDPTVLYLLKSRRAPSEREGYRSDDEALAYAVASFVRDSVEGKKLKVPQADSARTGERPWRYAEYDDFAVLLRTTGKQYILEKYLRLLAVPYSAGDVCGLFVESPANDVYQALRLAVYPEDGPAYAAFLRSPFTRISDDAFVRVLALKLPAFDPTAERSADLSEDDLERFRRGRGILDRLRASADREPISTLVRRLWFREGLRLSLLRKPDAHPFLEHFDYLFRLAADADARGLPLASFVAELEPLTGTPDRLADLDAPREAASGLRILTVHKAKGLEFPIVILPFLEGTGRGNANDRAWYYSRNHGITFNLKPWDDPEARKVNVFYDMAKEEETEQERAELKRLFYVACTRASAHLIFAAAEPTRADNRCASFHTLLVGGGGLRDASGTFPALPTSVREVPIPDLSEEDYLKLFGGKRLRDIEDLLPLYKRAESVERRYDRRELSATALNEAWTKIREASLPAGESAIPYEPLPELEHDNLAETVSDTLFGELCHAAVEAGLDPSSGGPEAFAKALSAFPESLRPLLEREAHGLAAAFLESDLGLAARNARELRLESSFLYSLEDELIVSGRADLLFRTERELIIVDFKSNKSRKDGEYDGQLAAYRAICGELYPGLKIRTWLFWLRASRAEERLPGDDDEAVMRKAARFAVHKFEETSNSTG